MVQLRATRRRAKVVLSDDDYSDSPSTPKKGPKGQVLKNQTLDQFSAPFGVLGKASTNAHPKPRPSSKSHSASQTSTPRPSPQKSKQSPQSRRVAAEGKPNGRTIQSFFNKATSRQRADPVLSPPKVEAEAIEEEDFIQDDDSFDEAMQQIASKHDIVNGSSTALAFRKRTRGTLGDANNRDTEGLGGSQKFRKVSDGSRASVSQPNGVADAGPDLRPWTEKYGPTNIDELAVHKKKIADVKTWLEDVIGGKDRKRLLVLKGAAGTAKTTTVSLLGKELGFEIKEWRNPMANSFGSEGYQSISAQFEDFLGRSGKFGSLDIFGPENALDPIDVETESSKKQVIMIEEFPNTFTRSSSAVQTFRSTILHYLAANTPSAASLFSSRAGALSNITPIVMIISETLLSTNTAAADSFTAHRLLGPELLNHAGTTVIEFNPIAPTILTKALDTVIQKDARKSGRRKAPGPQVLKRLCEIGDVRSAVSSLEFLCLRGDEGDGWSGKVAFAKAKKANKDTPLTKMERESLELMSQRESTLGIFHAVGKVVYNKREAPRSTTDPVPQPPPHLPQYHRPKPSDVDVNALIDELGTDTQTFIAALHENYVLSCEGAVPEDTVDCISDCIDALSAADLLSPERFSTGRGRSRFQYRGDTLDTLRQDELSFQSSVRSILFHLPNPVKRIAPPPSLPNLSSPGKSGTGGGWKGRAGGKADAFRMFYPTSLRLWQPREELEGLLDLYVARAQKGELHSNFGTEAASIKPAPPRKLDGGVESWQKNLEPALPPTITSFRAFKPKAARTDFKSSSSQSLAASSSVSLPHVRPERTDLRRTTTVLPPNTSTSSPCPDSADTAAPTIASVPRYELLLERLPYIANLHRRHPPTTSSFSVAASATLFPRDLDRLTRFTGAKTHTDANVDADEDDETLEAAAAAAEEQWSTDRPVEPGGSPVQNRLRTGRVVGSPTKRVTGADGWRNGAVKPESEVKGLAGSVLSDDDIVSD